MSFIHISIIEVTYNISEIPGECKTSGFKAMLDPEGLPKPLVGSVALPEGNPKCYAVNSYGSTKVPIILWRNLERVTQAFPQVKQYMI